MESSVFYDVQSCLHDIYTRLRNFHLWSEGESSALSESDPFSSWDHDLVQLPNAPPMLPSSKDEAWRVIEQYYHVMKEVYDTIGMPFLLEKKFWSLAYEAIRVAGGMQKQENIAREHISILSPPSFAKRRNDPTLNLSNYPPNASGVFPILHRETHMLIRLHFIFRNVTAETRLRLSHVLKVFDRVQESSKYLTALSGEVEFSGHGAGERGSESLSSFGVSVKLDEGSEQLSEFLEREHDIPLFQRQKMGSSLLNSVIELVKAVGDEIVVNGLTSECVIVSNAGRWRAARESGNSFMSPRLKVSIPWSYVQHGSRHDTCHVSSGLSVVLFEIMSLSRWKKPYAPMNYLEMISMFPTEVEFPGVFREVISSLEAKHISPTWLLKKSLELWDSFKADHITDIVPLLYRSMMYVGCEVPHRWRSFCRDVSFDDSVLYSPKIDEEHPLTSLLQEMNASVEKNIRHADSFYRKVLARSKSSGFLTPHCLIATLDTGPGFLRPIVTDLIRLKHDATDPLSFVFFALKRMFERGEICAVSFMHAYFKALISSNRALEKDAFLPLYTSIGLDIDFKPEAEAVMEKFIDCVISKSSSF
eukprot:TRINITY_DN1258_c0_g1_i3.p1 TRINITY_DN1258_c0_g1~~TRINITY_DN1258_c0_g1_i3.p1  ORF type:complete len:589 (-),score=127.42 TRINITY_DN1258_c0_g1_i3:44-1810(-)